MVVEFDESEMLLVALDGLEVVLVVFEESGTVDVETDESAILLVAPDPYEEVLAEFGESGTVLVELLASVPFDEQKSSSSQQTQY